MSEQINVAEAAHIAGVSQSCIRNWVACRKLPAPIARVPGVGGKDRIILDRAAFLNALAAMPARPTKNTPIDQSTNDDALVLLHELDLLVFEAEKVFNRARSLRDRLNGGRA